jgi:uroporphyrinogen decarboxylase
MYGLVRGAGKFQMIHSCGDVDELFDDLVGLGLNGFNPFQPEVMETTVLLEKYRGRLAFHGGLSTQRVLPYGTETQVREESRRLLALGREGSYIFAPSHAVESDVPLANILAFLDEAKQSKLEVTR